MRALGHGFGGLWVALALIFPACGADRPVASACSFETRWEYRFQPQVVGEISGTFQTFDAPAEEEIVSSTCAEMPKGKKRHKITRTVRRAGNTVTITENQGLEFAALVDKETGNLYSAYSDSQCSKGKERTLVFLGGTIDEREGAMTLLLKEYRDGCG